MAKQFLEFFIVAILFFFPNASRCQNKEPTALLDDHNASSFAYITVIDGKIPMSVISKISFIYNNQYDTAIYKNYYINNRHFSENFLLLDSIPDTATVFIDIFFEEPTGINKVKLHHYHDKMSLNRLKLVQIISITNFRHNCYYMYYVFDPPLRTYPNYDRCFGSKKKFYSKVFSCFYPYSYHKSSKGKKVKPSW